MFSRFHRPGYVLIPRFPLGPFFEDGAATFPARICTRWSRSCIERIRPLWTPWSKEAGYTSLLNRPRRRRRIGRYICFCLFLFPFLLLFLVLFETVFFPSYTHRPPHYNTLKQRAHNSTAPGRANVNNETVFIAASIYERNGSLTSGPWANAVLDLIDLLGPEHIYLSVYENDPDLQSKQSLSKFGHQLQCNHTINHESLKLADLPRVTLPSGDTRIKRIAFLAEVRNRALLPLQQASIKFDKLLFINDVVFDPVEAAQLLFSTNQDARGRTNYGAACAVDFINPFKFYDRFATRDLDGFSTGIPFFPWFTDAGSGTSRSDVIAGSDAVRVRSCWGGMAAFESKWFQNPGHGVSSPLRFRFEEEVYWDSSECCLINADLQYRRSGIGMPDDSGIYMNPFIRVAYDEKTLRWLSLTRRPERLYSLIHNILNRFVGFPRPNPRQTVQPGDSVTEESRNRSTHSHVAKPGGFCGGRKLLLINEEPGEGYGKWTNMPLPPPSATPTTV